MATIYLWHGATGSGDGSSFANAYTSWAAARAHVGLAGGDVICVASDHVEEVSAAITFDAPSGSITNPLIVVSVNRTSGLLEAGARISVASGTNATINFTSEQSQAMIVVGLTFSCESTENSTANDFNFANSPGAMNHLFQFVDCTFTIKATSPTAQASIGPVGASAARRVVFDGCTFNLPNAAVDGFFLLGSVDVEFINPTFAYVGATKPTRLFAWAAITPGNTNLIIRDGDISGFNTPGGFLFLVTDAANARILLRNLKLSATPGLYTGTFPGYSSSITLINVDSGDTVQKFAYYTKAGSAASTTSIYADAGAKVFGQNASLQIVTTSECTEGTPFRLPPIVVPHEGTSSITPKFMLAHDSAIDLHNRNIWIDWSQVSSASFPTGSVASSRNANPFLGTAADYDNNSEAWTGIGGFSNPNKQEIPVTFTPAEKAPLEARLFVGAASKTLYLDPLPRDMGDLGGIVWTGDALMVLPAGTGGGGGDNGGLTRFNVGFN